MILDAIKWIKNRLTPSGDAHSPREDVAATKLREAEEQADEVESNFRRYLDQQDPFWALVVDLYNRRQMNGGGGEHAKGRDDE